jgi:hypothetical protein
MPLYVSEDDISRRLKIDTDKPLTDEQVEAYYAAKDAEILPESAFLQQHENFPSGFWSRSLIVKYLRPFSLGPAATKYSQAKNTYTRASLRQAYKLVPLIAKLERLDRLPDGGGEIDSCIEAEEARIARLPKAEQAAANAELERILSKFPTEDEEA